MLRSLPTALYCIVFTLFLLLPATADGQVMVVDNQTASALVQKLVGNGITYLNPVLTCAPGANGRFAVTGTSNLGIDSGIVLTTGRAKTDIALGQIGVNGA